MKTLLIWTDGSCMRNPGGPGGWAYRIKRADGSIVEASGSEEATTNNRMEVMAVIRALESIAEDGFHIAIYSDSRYVIQTMLGKWRARTNHDLWARLHQACRGHRVEWRWVRGHNGDPDNGRVDYLAGQAARGVWMALPRVERWAMRKGVSVHGCRQISQGEDERAAKQEPCVPSGLGGDDPARHAVPEAGRTAAVDGPDPGVCRN